MKEFACINGHRESECLRGGMCAHRGCHAEAELVEREAHPDLLRELVNGLAQSIDAELAASAGLSRDYPNLYNMLNNWHGDICSALGEPAKLTEHKAADAAGYARGLAEGKRLGEARMRELEAEVKRLEVYDPMYNPLDDAALRGGRET
jgi:hypothetical protein